jgi:UDP-glucuronate decarboxylase
MHPNAGPRVASNFITRALQNTELTVYGEDEQTRSFQYYVSDLVDRLYQLDECRDLLRHSQATMYEDMPMNLGNPDDEMHSIHNFATKIKS